MTKITKKVLIAQLLETSDQFDVKVLSKLKKAELEAMVSWHCAPLATFAPPVAQIAPPIQDVIPVAALAQEAKVVRNRPDMAAWILLACLPLFLACDILIGEF